MEGPRVREPLLPTRLARAVGAVACALMGDTMLYTVLPASPGAFGVGPVQVGVLLSANRLVRLASNSLAGWAYLRFGLRRPFTAGVVLAVGAVLAYALGRGFLVLLGARLLWGMCYSLLRLGGQLVALEESRRRNRARAMGWFNGGQRLGSLLAALTGGFLFDTLGRAGGFGVAGLVTLLGVPLALSVGEGRWARPVPPTVRRAPAPGRPAGPARPLERALGLAGEAPPGTAPRLVAVSGVAFALFFAVAGLMTATLGFYLRQRAGEGISLFGASLGVATLTGLALAPRWLFDLLAPYLGGLADRFGRPRAVAVAVPALVGTLTVLALSPSLALSLAVLPLLFLSASAAYVSLDALAGDLAPRSRRPQVLGRYATWQDLGSALGPLAGYTFLRWVALEAVYLVAAGLLAFAFLLFLRAFAGDVRPAVPSR